MIRLAIVSPIMAIRAGLRALLEADESAVEQPVRIVAERADIRDLADEQTEIDVLILAPAGYLGEALRQADLQEWAGAGETRAALLLLTDNIQAAYQLAKLPVRAWGLLSIDTSLEELNAAVRALHEGLSVATPPLLNPILIRRQRTVDSPDQSLFPTGDIVEDPLTERESQVLQQLAMGLANKQIAVILGISEHTIKFHVSSIYTKLGASNRTEAVRIGVQRGLIAL